VRSQRHTMVMRPTPGRWLTRNRRKAGALDLHRHVRRRGVTRKSDLDADQGAPRRHQVHTLVRANGRPGEPDGEG